MNKPQSGNFKQNVSGLTGINIEGKREKRRRIDDYFSFGDCFRSQASSLRSSL